MDTLNVTRIRYDITSYHTKFKKAESIKDLNTQIKIREEIDSLWVKYISEIRRYKNYHGLTQLSAKQKESKLLFLKIN